MIKKSITKRLMLMFFIVGVSALTIVGIYSYYSAKNAILNRTLDQLTSIRIMKKSQIESFFNERIKNLIFLSNAAYIQNITKEIKTENFVEAQSYYSRIKAKSDYGIYGFSEQYIVIEKSDSLQLFSFEDKLISEKPDSISLKNINLIYTQIIENDTIIVSDFFKRNANDSIPICFIGSKIKDEENNILGILILQISISEINEIMLEKVGENGLGNSGEIYLVGKDYLMRSNSRFIENSVLNIKVETISAKNAFENNTGSAIIDDYRSIPVLSSYEKLQLKDLDWIIIAEIDYAEALVPVNYLRNDILFLSLLISIFIFSVAHIISRTITNPIINLKNNVQKIGKGELEFKNNPQLKDEIGMLYQSFSEMTQNLKISQNKVIEREKRLNHFYNATIEGIVFHENNKIINVNKAFENLTLYNYKELKNKELTEVLNLQCANFNENNEIKFPFECFIIRKDKVKIQVEINENLNDTFSEEIKIYVVRDISVRKNIEAALEQERLKKLSALIDGQEIERQRISRELHDSLGQKLIALKLNFENLLSKELNFSSEKSDEMRQNFTNVINEVRNISHNLAPGGLTEFGIETILKILCTDIKNSSNIETEFFSHGNFTSFDNLDKKTSAYLYRIAQEALNNSVKHSNATNINVNFIESKDNYVLTIEDNGKGFEYSKNMKINGNGINNIQERVKLINGIFNIETSKNKGTTIIVKIPK